MAKTSVNTMDQPMKIKESMAYRVFNVFNTILMILICAAMLYPFLYLVAQSSPPPRPSSPVKSG